MPAQLDCHGDHVGELAHFQGRRKRNVQPLRKVSQEVFSLGHPVPESAVHEINHFPVTADYAVVQKGQQTHRVAVEMDARITGILSEKTPVVGEMA